MPLKTKTYSMSRFVSVIAPGFEPGTACLEGRCSIQLSYATLIVDQIQSLLSGWQDSNLRPPGPKPGAITELRYTPKKSGETGTRTLATFARRQISNLLRYHSGTSPLFKKAQKFYPFCGCKCSS